jgi:CheY-specific phosphatase CheX
MDAVQTNALITGYLERSSIDLFHDVGAEFRVITETDWLPDIAAIIGFAGDSVAGSLALGTSHECLTTLAKLSNTQMYQDWLGELSNQLLGRVKRKLSCHGASFDLGTPIVVMGERLRLTRSTARCSALSSNLDSQNGHVVVWFEFEFRNDFELSEQPEADGSLTEGEALLF